MQTLLYSLARVIKKNESFHNLNNEILLNILTNLQSLFPNTVKEYI